MGQGPSPGAPIVLLFKVDSGQWPVDSGQDRRGKAHERGAQEGNGLARYRVTSVDVAKLVAPDEWGHV